MQRSIASSRPAGRQSSLRHQQQRPIRCEVVQTPDERYLDRRNARADPQSPGLPERCGGLGGTGSAAPC
eukprot:974790-Prorocentrum_minimum.AAC.1